MIDFQMSTLTNLTNNNIWCNQPSQVGRVLRTNEIQNVVESDSCCVRLVEVRRSWPEHSLIYILATLIRLRYVA